MPPIARFFGHTVFGPLPSVGFREKCALDLFDDFGAIYIVCLFTWLPPLTSSFLYLFFLSYLLPYFPGQRS